MSDSTLMMQYIATLKNKASGTVVGYQRALDAFVIWLDARPGSQGEFQAEAFTKTAVEAYFAKLKPDYGPSYRTRVKAALSGFADWLIEHDQLRRNPTRGLHIEAQALLAPRVLDEEQRYVLRSLVERENDPRGMALFALGYYAGCRVSDVSWQRLENVHLTERGGWLKVGYKGSNLRDIDLTKQAKQALAEYLGHITQRGTPAVQTTVRYTQASREQIRGKLKLLS